MKYCKRPWTMCSKALIWFGIATSVFFIHNVSANIRDNLYISTHELDSIQIEHRANFMQHFLSMAEERSAHINWPKILVQWLQESTHLSIDDTLKQTLIDGVETFQYSFPFVDVWQQLPAQDCIQFLYFMGLAKPPPAVTPSADLNEIVSNEPSQMSPSDKMDTISISRISSPELSHTLHHSESVDQSFKRESSETIPNSESNDQYNDQQPLETMPKLELNDQSNDQQPSGPIPNSEPNDQSNDQQPLETMHNSDSNGQSNDQLHSETLLDSDSIDPSLTKRSTETLSNSDPIDPSIIQQSSDGLSGSDSTEQRPQEALPDSEATYQQPHEALPEEGLFNSDSTDQQAQNGLPDSETTYQQPHEALHEEGLFNSDLTDQDATEVLPDFVSIEQEATETLSNTDSTEQQPQDGLSPSGSTDQQPQDALPDSDSTGQQSQDPLHQSDLTGQQSHEALPKEGLPDSDSTDQQPQEGLSDSDSTEQEALEALPYSDSTEQEATEALRDSDSTEQEATEALPDSDTMDQQPQEGLSNTDSTEQQSTDAAPTETTDEESVETHFTEETLSRDENVLDQQFSSNGQTKDTTKQTIFGEHNTDEQVYASHYTVPNTNNAEPERMSENLELEMHADHLFMPPTNIPLTYFRSKHKSILPIPVAHPRQLDFEVARTVLITAGLALQSTDDSSEMPHHSQNEYDALVANYTEYLRSNRGVDYERSVAACDSILNAPPTDIWTMLKDQTTFANPFYQGLDFSMTVSDEFPTSVISKLADAWTPAHALEVLAKAAVEGHVAARILLSEIWMFGQRSIVGKNAWARVNHVLRSQTLWRLSRHAWQWGWHFERIRQLARMDLADDTMGHTVVKSVINVVSAWKQKLETLKYWETSIQLDSVQDSARLMLSAIYDAHWVLRPPSLVLHGHIKETDPSIFRQNIDSSARYGDVDLLRYHGLNLTDTGHVWMHELLYIVKYGFNPNFPHFIPRSEWTEHDPTIPTETMDETRTETRMEAGTEVETKIRMEAGTEVETEIRMEAGTEAETETRAETRIRTEAKTESTRTSDQSSTIEFVHLNWSKFQEGGVLSLRQDLRTDTYISVGLGSYVTRDVLHKNGFHDLLLAYDRGLLLLTLMHEAKWGIPILTDIKSTGIVAGAFAPFTQIEEEFDHNTQKWNTVSHIEIPPVFSMYSGYQSLTQIQQNNSILMSQFLEGHVRLAGFNQNAHSIQVPGSDDALTLLQVLAQHGDTAASLAYSYRRLTGVLGTQKSCEAAFRYYMTAAAATIQNPASIPDDRSASISLQNIWNEPRISTAVEEGHKGIEYHDLQAQGGDVFSAAMLGEVYFHGDAAAGIQQNFGLARQYFRMAADGGLAHGHANLAMMYINGFGENHENEQNEQHEEVVFEEMEETSVYNSEQASPSSTDSTTETNDFADDANTDASTMQTDINAHDHTQTDIRQTNINAHDHTQTDIRQTDINAHDHTQTGIRQTDINAHDHTQTDSRQTDINAHDHTQTDSRQTDINAHDTTQTDINNNAHHHTQTDNMRSNMPSDTTNSESDLNIESTQLNEELNEEDDTSKGSPFDPIWTAVERGEKPPNDYWPITSAGLNVSGAVYHFVRATQLGEPAAYNGLGYIYMQGFGGLSPNMTKAAEYFQHAADAGMSEAYANLAVLYMQGSGVAMNLTHSKVLLEKAVELDDRIVNAKFNLALMYYYGWDTDGMHRQCEPAVMLLKSVAERGPWRQQFLASIDGVVTSFISGLSQSYTTGINTKDRPIWRTLMQHDQNNVTLMTSATGQVQIQSIFELFWSCSKRDEIGQLKQDAVMKLIEKRISAWIHQLIPNRLHWMHRYVISVVRCLVWMIRVLQGIGDSVRYIYHTCKNLLIWKSQYSSMQTTSIETDTMYLDDDEGIETAHAAKLLSTAQSNVSPGQYETHPWDLTVRQASILAQMGIASSIENTAFLLERGIGYKLFNLEQITANVLDTYMLHPKQHMYSVLLENARRKAETSGLLSYFEVPLHFRNTSYVPSPSDMDTSLINWYDAATVAYFAKDPELHIFWKQNDEQNDEQNVESSTPNSLESRYITDPLLIWDSWRKRYASSLYEAAIQLDTDSGLARIAQCHLDTPYDLHDSKHFKLPYDHKNDQHLEASYKLNDRQIRELGGDAIMTIQNITSLGDVVLDILTLQKSPNRRTLFVVPNSGWDGTCSLSDHKGLELLEDARLADSPENIHFLALQHMSGSRILATNATTLMGRAPNLTRASELLNTMQEQNEIVGWPASLSQIEILWQWIWTTSPEKNAMSLPSHILMFLYDMVHAACAPEVLDVCNLEYADVNPDMSDSSLDLVNDESDVSVRYVSPHAYFKFSNDGEDNKFGPYPETTSSICSKLVSLRITIVSVVMTLCCGLLACLVLLIAQLLPRESANI